MGSLMFGDLHYKPRKISEVKESDLRVAIIGKVVEMGENSFILDDGTAKVEIIFEGKVEKNKLIRVFCSVLNEKLRADIIQDLKGFDLNLFNRVNELYSKAGLNV